MNLQQIPVLAHQYHQHQLPHTVRFVKWENIKNVLVICHTYTRLCLDLIFFCINISIIQFHLFILVSSICVYMKWLTNKKNVFCIDPGMH